MNPGIPDARGGFRYRKRLYHPEAWTHAGSRSNQMCWSNSIAFTRALIRRRRGWRDAKLFSRSTFYGCIVLAFLCSVTVRGQASADQPGDIRGLPPTRFYPFEEIGNVSRGARLGFDAFGRLAVIHDSAYVVLDDSTWVDLAERADPPMLNVVAGADGRWYYGALGSWGVADWSSQGRLCEQPLMPASSPSWVNATNFSEILSLPRGMYFAGWNGVAYFDFALRSTVFVPVRQVTQVFHSGDRVFVSSHREALCLIDVANGVARPVPDSNVAGLSLDRATQLDGKHVLLSTIDGRFFVFDGVHASPWRLVGGPAANHRVAAMQRLVDGGVAVAITDEGLFLAKRDGQVVSSLTTPEYHGITDLATREPGVLWVANEDGIGKVLYGSPVSFFSQRLGLPVNWPKVVRWNGRVLVSSGGDLYGATEAVPSGATHFRPIANQPAAGVWSIAATGPRLLVGNAAGVFVGTSGGHFDPVIQMDVAQLVMVSPELCYVIGTSEIAALRWTGKRWEECAPRVPGLGFPAIAHAAKTSAWIELGPNRAARVALHGDRLDVRLFDHFPWTEPHWIHFGLVGNTVILSGPNRGRIFFDEKSETVGPAPELERLLDQAPFWVTRIESDDSGTLWAAHDRGVFTITRDADGVRYDTTTFDFINDNSPLIEMPAGNDIWFCTGQSLYHVDRRSFANPRNSFQPVLVSVFDGRTDAELVHGSTSIAMLRDLPYSRNNLDFRFFAGSYACRRPLWYEFTLARGDRRWTTQTTGSTLSLPELWEGDYRLDVRLTDSHGAFGKAISLPFSILPPWYRSWYAYAFYAALMAAAVWGLVSWLIRRTRARNVVLKKLVEKRTKELETKMHRLNEEIRSAATLAERDRLAGEIHDGLQQGLSGLILQLDATLKMPGLSEDIRSRLTIARKTVAFTRQELRHAVWDMEPPLLQGTELADALQKITKLVGPKTAAAKLNVTGNAYALSSTVKHHLLRIAQEAITNAVRHSRTKLITVRLDYQPDIVVLTVADDGCGFDPTGALGNEFGHFGLRGMRARAAKIGGELHLESAPGAGTTITITVPVRDPDRTPLHATTYAG